MDGQSRFTRFISGRKTKWIVLVGWLLLVMGTGPLAGQVAGVQENDTAQWLPGNAEATQVVELQKRFSGPENAPAVVVYVRDSGITPEDRTKVAADVSRLADADGVVGQVVGPVPSENGKALHVVVPLQLGTEGWEKIADRVDAVRATAESGAAGLSVHVAGPAAFNADSSKAFAGIDGKLLGATVLVVIVILLLVYRSPVLWLLPVICSGLALGVSQAFIYLLAEYGGLTVNGQTAGILTVLVFGVGTDYALLLIARYREELRRHADRHEAMAVALHRAGPAIVASAATVAVGMLCLLFADMNSTKGLGPVAAFGVVVALLTMTTLLPALLVVLGRWLFWPKRPVPGTEPAVASGAWSRLGQSIARRPRPVWIGTSLVLAALAFGLFQLDADGLDQKDALTNTPPSVTAQEVLAEHFPAGNGQPVVVIGKATHAAQLRQTLAGAEGISSASEPVVRGDLALVEGTLTAQPDSQDAEDTVTRIRDAVHALPGADAKVGGLTALTMDLNEANDHDNRLIIPLVLVAILLILFLLLRAVVAPLVLLGTVVLSFAAALGISALLFRHVLGFEGADTSLPLLVFVFLVALGVDYNIFLMTRVREEALRRGARQGALVGLSTTGGVITSAGLVLAATFAVFGAIPMVSFAEMGLAVAIGVLLDTFVVRSVLLTALNLDLGPKMWWPGPLASASQPEPTPEPTREPAQVG